MLPIKFRFIWSSGFFREDFKKSANQKQEMLYGLETLNLQNKDMATLCSIHLSTLKRLQSLPIRTANSAVYLLLVILPISAELHKRQLSLFHQIVMSENVSIREIAWRQYIAGRPTSFFVRIVDILDLYELPSFIEVMSGHFKKLDWKGIVKMSINTYWTTKLQQDCQSKSTLSLLSTTSLEMGKTHIVWDSINNSVRDVRKAITKARMLTGTYMLQTLKSKVQPGRGGFDLPNLQTGNRNHDSRYHKLSSI